MRIPNRVGATVLGMLTAMAAGTGPTAGREGQERTGASRPQGVLESAPDMRVARAAHTATLLSDGRVLVAGGFVEKGSPDGAEVFDPGPGRFYPLPPMLTTRHSHTATLLPDGRVLIAGGYGTGTTTLSAAEIFDPRTNAFTTTGSLAGARADHIAVPLANGRVLIAGGLGPDWTFLSSAELYDPATGRCTPTGAMTVPRESHAAVLLRDGRVFIVGGHRGRRSGIRLYASAEIYDPSTGRFSPAGEMRIRRHKHDAVLLRDGRVLIHGGTDERDDRGVFSSTEIFDPGTGRFTPGPELSVPRYKHAGTSLGLPDGRILLAGGASRAEIYDPDRNVFTLVEGAPRMAGQFSAAAPLKNGGALITGGYGSGTGPRPSAWVYRP